MNIIFFRLFYNYIKMLLVAPVATDTWVEFAEMVLRPFIQPLNFDLRYMVPE